MGKKLLSNILMENHFISVHGTTQVVLISEEGERIATLANESTPYTYDNCDFIIVVYDERGRLWVADTRRIEIYTGNLGLSRREYFPPNKAIQEFIIEISKF